MEYENRIVCFFDILGFGDIIQNKKMSANEVSNLFNEIDIIMNLYRGDNITISHFSDSIAISIRSRNSSPTQLQFVIDTLEKLLEYGLIARGSIVYGEVMHTKTNIFGPALVKAAHLEKEVAKYPRIILDESLDILPLPTAGNAQITYRSYFNGFKYVKVDTDNEFYIDILGELKKHDKLERLKVVIEKTISEGLELASHCNDERLLAKYTWLKSKYENV